MTTLFGRTARLTIGDTLIEDLRIGFNVTRTLKKEPNTAEIAVWNLSRSRRDQLSREEDLPVVLEAGLGDRLSVLFAGELRFARSMPEGNGDWITTLSNGDKDKQFRTARVARSYRPGVDGERMLKDLLGDLGAGLGNLVETIKGGSIPDLGSVVGRGVSFSGSAAKVAEDVLKSAGYEYSIQNGVLQVLERNKPLAGRFIDLSPTTGLLGVPAIDDKGVVEFQSLMVPDMDPGIQCKITSSTFNGDVRVETVRTTGDTRGQDYGHRCEGKAL